MSLALAPRSSLPAGWIMATIPTSSEEQGRKDIGAKGKDGLVGKQVYSVLQVREAEDGPMGNVVRLLRLRNPQCDFEWRGPWSDDSYLWDKYPEVKKSINPSLDGGDGEFWMEYGGESYVPRVCPRRLEAQPVS